MYKRKHQNWGSVKCFQPLNKFDLFAIMHPHIITIRLYTNKLWFYLLILYVVLEYCYVEIYRLIGWLYLVVSLQT